MMPYDYACVLFAIFRISDRMKSYKIDQVNTSMCLPFITRTLSWKMSTWSMNNIKCFKCCHHHFLGHNYQDLNLGFVTKAKAQGANWEWSPGVTLHVPRSVGECEGMNPHTPKWAPTLGTRVSMDSRIFKEWLQGSKFIELKKNLYRRKTLET
jgi:hypothetical protein